MCSDIEDRSEVMEDVVQLLSSLLQLSGSLVVHRRFITSITVEGCHHTSSGLGESRSKKKSGYPNGLSSCLQRVVLSPLNHVHSAWITNMFQCHSFTSGGRLDDPSSDYTKDSLSFESVSITQLLVHGAELCALKVTSLWEEGRAGHKAARARKKHT